MGIKEMGFWTLSIVRIFKTLNTHTGKKGKGTPILLDPLERANLRTETDPVSETSCIQFIENPDNG
jgi:uncharacterized membrane protein